jgi:hypothetical protein
MTPLQFRTLPFEEAATHWLEIKKMHSKKSRTIEMYEWYVRNLKKIFAGVLRGRRRKVLSRGSGQSRLERGLLGGIADE